MDEMKDAVSEKKGFVKAMWCGDEACEDEIKAQTGGVTSRCIPYGSRNICLMYASAVENLRNIWFTGEEHTKIHYL